jgi:hypothetical protein
MYREEFIDKPHVLFTDIFDIKAVTSEEELRRLADADKKLKAQAAGADATSIKFSILESDAHAALKSVVENLRENKPILYAALHACTIIPTDKGVKLIASNSIQQGQIEKENATVLTMLREALKQEINMQVVADAGMAAPQADKIPYTAAERFEYLANQNPLLRALRDEYKFDIN